MNRFVSTPDLAAVFSGRQRIPTITLWNRLEGRPRTHDFERALKAEIRDPLWMLTKQWQMGEFKGDDAGSPITAKVQIDTTELTKYQAANHLLEAFDDDVPLEAKVGQRPIPFALAGQPMALDLRLALGRRWLKLVGGLEPGLAAKFIARFPIAAPDPSDPASAPVAAHRESFQSFAALAGRAMDGYALYAYLGAAAGNHAYDGIALANAANTGPIETAEKAFRNWYEQLFYQRGNAEDAWLPERLEYAFAAAAPQSEGGEMNLVADEYLGGRLDWYSLDIAKTPAGLGNIEGAPAPADVEASAVASLIPVPIRFNGMPNTRWWTFEEGRTNFGDIDPETTDVNKLLLIEFALVYANDWFLLPFTVTAGSIAKIRGMSVTNVFGEKFWIESAGKGADENWQRWSMFTLATRGSDDVPADTSLLILPGSPKIQESEAVEAIQLTRDEMANMVWGIETTVALPDGSSKAGRRAALETHGYFTRIVEAAAPPAAGPALLENEAAIRYQTMTDIPENWIPFIPVHVDGSTRETQLRRAGMLRIIEGEPDAPLRVEARTALLRPGLDQMPRVGYDVHEEEVPRAGIRVRQVFQRTRWYDGEVFLWFGARKEAGRGEHSSGLAFDAIPPKERS